MVNLKLNYTGFDNNLVKKWTDNVRLLDGIVYRGVHYLFKFNNDYGASVVKNYESYGYKHDLWELAVVRFNRGDINDWDLDYDTRITSDVLGYLTDDQIRNLLEEIKNL